MNVLIVQNLPRLHTTPLPSIRIEESRVVVDLDDEFERRFQLVFQPYQGVRIITTDCFQVPTGMAEMPKAVVEILDSEWITDLKRNLKQTDETANFMEKSRHFIVPLQDKFLEVIAWSVAVV